MSPVTPASFAADLQNPSRPVVLEFTAPWCAPCKRIVPVLEELEARHGVPVYVVDTQDHPEIGERFKVLHLPTVVLLDRAGVVRARHVGADRRGVEAVFAQAATV